MEISFNSIKDILNIDVDRKYYVYRLVDPRTFQTFYVGKGCGNRVFQHAYNVEKLIKSGRGDDEESLKSRQILDIINAGKKVISIIHRRGLTKEEAFEVEAALIDAYPGLTNIQRGHNPERGAITVEDLYMSYNIQEYTEPSEKYIIIKTTIQTINEKGGSIYEATRQSWDANLEKAEDYKYVLAVVSGIVKEVFIVNRWVSLPNGRIAFEGEIANDEIAKLKGFRIPNKYRKRGLANPFLYSKP